MVCSAPSLPVTSRSYGQTVSGVKIPENFEVALEIPMVLNDAGVIGLSLNGKSSRPPSHTSSRTVTGWWCTTTTRGSNPTDAPHQFPMLVFARDGIPLDHPYFADTLSVAPGERFSVLMHMDDPGTWVFHCTSSITSSATPGCSGWSPWWRSGAVSSLGASSGDRPGRRCGADLLLHRHRHRLRPGGAEAARGAPALDGLAEGAYRDGEGAAARLGAEVAKVQAPAFVKLAVGTPTKGPGG